MFAYDLNFWGKAYAHEGETMEETLEKISQIVSNGEKDLENEFKYILKEGHFLPGGRILAYCGSKYKKGTLMNCFVMPSPEDNMESILDVFNKSILTWKAGGGIGINFSKLRSKDSFIQGTGCRSSGVLGFMRLWNTASEILQGVKYRKGAMLAVLNDNHPDVYDFITAKETPEKRANYCFMNISVGITDSINVDNKLLEKIADTMFKAAEPGVIFLDRINKYNNLNKKETIECANPCSEAPLQAYGACCLGSIILPSFVKGNNFDWEEYERSVALAVQFLDSVLDISFYPLPEQEKEAKSKRKIGLGFLGLADTLALLGIEYGSQESFDFAEMLAQRMSIIAYSTSVILAKAKGAFEGCDEEVRDYICSIRTHLPESVKAMIKQYGLRNASITAIAPTGSLSQLCGNMSSGIEPIFAKEYTRCNYGKPETQYNYAYRINPNCKIVEAYDVNIEKQLRMVESVQKYIDGSISKTVNLPRGSNVQDICDVLNKIVHEFKYIKGFTVYVDGTFEKQILCKDGTCTL